MNAIELRVTFWNSEVQMDRVGLHDVGQIGARANEISFSHRFDAGQTRNRRFNPGITKVALCICKA